MESAGEEDVDDLELLTRPGHEEELRFFLKLLHPADVAELVQDVDQKTALAILKHLEPERAGDLLSELDPQDQERILSLIKPEELAPIVGSMDTDDITDLIQELDQETASEVLTALPVADRAEVTKLLKFDPSSAGGLMQTEVASVSVDATATSALEAVRRTGIRQFLSLFVIDKDGAYVGHVNLQDLVFAPPGARVETLKTPKVAEVRPNVDQSEVARIFDHYSLVELGVVDDAGRLIGRITADDVHEVLVEEADEDMLKVAGTRADTDVIYSDKVFLVAWLRLPWLASNFVSGFIAAGILSGAHVVFGTIMVLLTFVPIITGMSGNVGSQSAMIMIRGMAAGNVTDEDFSRHIVRDLMIGGLMALACGIAVTGAVTLWKGSLVLGLCVGVSLALSMVVASVLGSVEPGLLKRMGVDPAIAAGPLITSLNDITGVVIYTLVALAFLRFF